MTIEVDNALRFHCPTCAAAPTKQCRIVVWSYRFSRSILIAPGEVHPSREAMAVQNVVDRLQGKIRI